MTIEEIWLTAVNFEWSMENIVMIVMVGFLASGAVIGFITWLIEQSRD